MKFILLIIILMSMLAQPKQGLEGFLRESKGNQMGNQAYSKMKGRPFESTLYIFRKLDMEDLIGVDGQWCKSIKEKPYKIITTDKDGYFKCPLKPGNYVVLVGAYDGYFIPSFNQYNQPSNIEVRVKHWEQLNILVNSTAIY